MPVEFGKKEGAFVWIRNPFNGCATYFNQIHKKTLAQMSKGNFLRTMMTEPQRGVEPSREVRKEMAAVVKKCVFCPGNEDKTTGEVLRVGWTDIFDHDSLPERTDPDSWAMRVVHNIIPRVPEECTGGLNESYVVIEDSRHFHPHANRIEEVIYSGMLDPRHFFRLMELDIEVMRKAYSNPHVRSVVIRKNQGAESGASQPHIHNQVLGADRCFPDILKEIQVTEKEPNIWEAAVEVIRDIGLVIEEDEGIVTYWSPYGKFPRSFEVVMLREKGPLTELDRGKLFKFSGALHRMLAYHGPIPLDYEIHGAPGIPIHAHLNSRLFTYSNIGGTINVPADVNEKAIPIREGLLRLKAEYPTLDF